MAEMPTAPTVPPETPDQRTLSELPRVPNPYQPTWWTAQTISGVPETVMGWLVAQGWKITLVSSDNSTVPPTRTYTVWKDQLSPKETLLHLCNNYTTNANDARDANKLRYAEVITDWTEMIASTQVHFGAQQDFQDVQAGFYLSDLGDYMDAIETLSDTNISDLTTEYTTHAPRARALLTDLGIAEVARINEQFASKLSIEIQDLIDRGLYSSAVYIDITERNHRDRDEQLQKHYDFLAREKLTNEHQLYAERSGLSDHTHRAIVERMNTAVARLEGWRGIADENRKLMAYQLDERNKLLIGLYSFVERREDIAPEWKDMASMIAGLADSAGGWVQP